MKLDISKYIKEFENNIELLKKDYLAFPHDFFFTEKEIHAYFYHLCLNSKHFITKSGNNLIHTEYPTPFKCETLKDKPYIKYAEIKADKIRSHVDLVLLNPNFVNWIESNGKGSKYIAGLTNGLFSEYILDLSKNYKEFEDHFKEPVLLYALEFKFLRHSFSGTKYPIKEILYDIEKLRLLKKIEIDGTKHNFCKNTLAIVIIGQRNISRASTIKDALPKGKEHVMIMKE